VGEITSTLLIKALDGLSARQAATAENIANANSPGFRPLRVSFEAALAAAARRGGEGAVRAVEARTQSAAMAEPVRVDLELATASATAGRYSAITELLNRQMQIEAIAITGGR
jgi:flagellar basal-body rod protein FlgB